MLCNPSLINAALVELAGWPGVAPAAVPFAFRFDALSLLLPVTLALLQPLSGVLGMLSGLLARVVAWTASPGAGRSLAMAAAGNGSPIVPSR